MATGIPATSSPQTLEPPASEQLLEQQLIEQQLSGTGRRLKLADLAAATMSWVAGVLSLLLLAALVDHWLFDLGAAGRLLGFAAMVSLTSWFAVMRVAPLLMRRINPVYAARSIEEGAPELKNSVVNYLTLRSQPQLSSTVLDVLTRRAAEDLERTDPGMSVDREHVIRAGYVMAGLLVAVCLYGVFSPKSSLDTARRVLMPWLSLQRPSRIRVVEVLPGDTEVLRGRQVHVTARLRGLDDGETPRVVFSSADGQLLDITRPMTGESGLWHADIPAAGAEQDLRYQVRAGDGRSPEYSVRVRAVPTIAVNEVRLTPPAYTQLGPRITAGGEIVGLDGARATVRAQASDEMQAAKLHLHTADGQQQVVAMHVDGRAAEATVTLALDRAGAATHTKYHVSYRTPAGHASQAPVVHSIEVLQDLAPVLQILAPRMKEVELPEDGELTVEVRALDPDFALRQLALEGVAGGAAKLQDARSYDNHRGQIVERFVIVPRRLGLRAGEELACRASAADNRCDASGAPDPNVTRSSELRIRIAAPAATKPPPEAPRDPKDAATDPRDAKDPRGTPPDKKGRDDKDEGDKDKGEKDKGDKGEGDKGEGDKGEGDKGEGDKGEGDKGEGDKGEGDKGEGDKGEGDKGEGDKGEGDKGEGDKGEGDKGEGDKGEGDKGEGDKGEGDKTDKGEGDKGDGTDQGSKDPSGTPQQGAGGAGERGGDTPTGSPPGSGDAQQGTGASGNQPGDGRGGSPQGSPGAANSPRDATGNSDPTSSGPQEPLHDGEVIEKLARKLQEQQAGRQGSDSRDSRTDQTQGSDGGGGRSGAGSEGVDERATGADDNTGAAPPTQLNPQPGDSRSGNRPEGGNQDSRQPGLERDLGDAKSAGVEPGEGGSPQGGAETNAEQADPDRKRAVQSAPGEGDNGDSGEPGPESKNPGGSPASLNENQPVDKSRTAPKGTSDDDVESPPAPSLDKRQRDIDGGETGDRSGGGGKGGGQGGKREGNDSAGSHSAADEGAGAAPHSGQGETAQRAGDKQQAKGASGRPGEERGSGSTQRKADSGDAGGSGRNDKPSAQDTAKGVTAGTGPQGAKRGGAGEVTGGGVGGEQNGATTPPPPPRTPRDKANLDYASKATDLVLDYLKNQQQRPSADLLNELNWTDDELRAFVKRWEQMRQAAGQSAAGRRQWEDALSGLGLQSPAARTVEQAGRVDQLPQVVGGAGSVDLPARYRQKFNAFRQRSN